MGITADGRHCFNPGPSSASDQLQPGLTRLAEAERTIITIIIIIGIK